MSIDRRLRNGLRASADTVTPDELTALRQVERRANGYRRRRQVLRLATAAITVVVLAIAIPLGVSRLQAPDPVLTSTAPTVAGAYIVDIADSSWADNESMAGRWVVKLGGDGTMELMPPDNYPGGRAGSSYQLNGDQLRTNAFINDLCNASTDTSPVGSYRWVRTTSTLRFTVQNDSCQARRLFFTTPVWQRVQ